MEAGEATVHGAASIVNAIPSGLGGSFAIGLKMRVQVKLKESGRALESTSKLVKRCIEIVFKKVGYRGDAEVKIESEIPVSMGLKSSSAVSTAAVIAAFRAFNVEPSVEEVLRISVESSLETGTSITGAYDDAAACILGGYVLTDNYRRKILKRGLLDSNLKVVIFLPPYQNPTWKVSDQSSFKNLSVLIHKLALRGHLWDAMTLNGILQASILNIDVKPSIESIKSGALGAGVSGTGPATVAVCTPESLDKVISALKRFEGKILVTEVENEPVLKHG